MRRNRDKHRHIRCVYRACRRIYGIEKAQDECLILFKIVFPDYYKATRSGEEFYKMSDTALERMAALFDKWKPEKELKKLCEWTLVEASKIMEREAFITFCNDILCVVMRIRKLTPTECFRLMDVDDKDIRTLLDSGLSNSACYAMAGNSIVVSVMVNLFDKLFINTGQEMKKGTQLSLF